MSTQRDELAAEIADVYLSNMGAGPLAGKVTQFDLAEAILTAGYRKPRTITTVEELDALPTDAVVMSETVAHQKYDATTWAADGRWYDTGQIALPATVLYEPTA